MRDVERKLYLGRNKLIALALVLGCDYVAGGLPGIGPKTALQGFEALTDAQVLDT